MEICREDVIIIGIPILIFGKSGSGKSRSLKNFAEDEIFYVNVENKPLPFRKKFKFEIASHNVNTIIDGVKKMGSVNVKTAVIDDAGYLQTEYFMRHHRAKQGNASFEMYDEMADQIYNLITTVKELPSDVIVYITFHEDVNENGDIGIKTIGRLLDRKVCLEGMCTVVLHCMSDGKKHYFTTQTNGKDIAKSPEDLFSAEEIENDLKAVDEKIREFYGINIVEKGEK